jgi:peptidoglycan hydrolase-like protein with peptidoglycan-binding domain
MDYGPMDYGTDPAWVACGNCGEPAQGHYCRMCGTPVGAPTGVAADGQASLAGLPGYDGYDGYGATRLAAPRTAESTQAMAAVPAGYAGGGYGPSAGPEPTQMYAPLPTPPTQPPTEFDSLFRSEDGSPGLHGQTQMLPPVVDTDYRMEPPGGARRPPGTHGDAGDEEPRTNRPVIFATLGAVVVAAAVIIGLLYLGNQSTNTNAGASANTPAKVTNATASQAPGMVQIPTNAAPVSPSAPAASATTAASTAAATGGAFSGDSLPLGPGSSGTWVSWVQTRLKQLGDYHGSISGDFDQATALAVQQFQASAGVTGDAASTVGQHTLVALAAAGSTPNLRLGSHSSSVARLDEALNLAAGTSLSGDRYSVQTAEAVAQYQQSVGMQPTGQLNAATWAKLQTGTLAG